ncbi:pectinesterase family protein [Gaetbulibacter aquiaggeris]|uniref:Pectinesterase family protein n=1 Tax=Gaetbulibacter aquiaggeris TaxID=1735373 RepID=A0ABW7MM49_9FLAO
MNKLSLFLIITLLLLATLVQGQTTFTYNLGDGTTFVNTGVQWDPVTTTTSPDGKLRTQAPTSQWHSLGYGVVFKDGNSLEVDVTGTSTIRFYGSVYSAGTMSGGTTIGASDLGTVDVLVGTDKTGFYEFNYTGGATTLFFTFSGANAYTPSIDITYPYTIYNLRDQSTFTNTGTQWDPVTSTTSPDGKIRTQAATTQWHSAGYGVVFKDSNSLEVDVAEGSSTVRFYGSVYSAGTMNGGTTTGASDLGSIDVDLDNHPGMADQTGYYEFNYVGGATTLYFTFSGSNAYTPAIEVTNLPVSIVKTDVWDFGAEQLDDVLYNNMLTESVINSFYTYVDPQVPGDAGRNILSFTAGDLGYVTNGTSDRLRTTNLNLTRWDTNIASSVNFTGRLYVNSGANTGRYLTLNLNEDDEVTIEGRTDAGGTFNFEYAADPVAQTDQVVVPAAETTIKFVAKQTGEYHVFDTSGKPSYFRVFRKAATYKTLTGSVDETNAPGIPDGYTIDFTNEAGKTFSTIVTAGSYSIDLPIEYTYALSLGGANGYVISNGDNLSVTETTTTYDIEVLQVDLYTVTGAISGLTDLTNLVLHYTPNPSANKIFIPKPVIDAGLSTYSVKLEPGIEYGISADGVNDFEILANTITITGDDTADIIFTSKPLYNVTINTPGLDVTQRSVLSLTFTNKNEPGYSYNFTDVSAVALRDGTYTVGYDGLDAYPIELALTSNLTISGVNTSKDLTFNPITEWVFNDRNISSATAYKGLVFTGSVNVRGSSGDLNAGTGATISIPVKVGDKVLITDYYQSNYSIEGDATIANTSGSTSTKITTEYIYQGLTDGTVTLTTGGTSYFVSIKVLEIVAYNPTITVGVGKDYQSINEALNAIALMDRPSDERVTVEIDPGNYEEMLVINSPNITLKNASGSPSIALLNGGVDIDVNAVRITSYYGQKYNFFSQGTDNKWHADVLAVNKDNGYTDYVNKEGTGNGTSYWNATVVVAANGFIAEDIILENSFNQYISQKESQDVVQPKASDPVRPTNYGNTSVQDRSAGYVTQAAAIGIANNTDKVILNNCRVIGRQDSFYGGSGSRVVVYKGAMMGAVDYIFGGMTAVFYQTDFVLNTSDSGSDAAYITAAQQSSGRGFLMYECHVKSPIPGVETASVNGSKPGYFGRPWAPNTSEVVFYNTTIDESTYPGSEGLSLISTVGWTSSLGGESNKMYEYGTIENASGVDNSSLRASWSTVLSTPTLTDDTAITTFNFTKGTDNWDPISELNALGIDDFKVGSTSVKVSGYNNKIHVSQVKSKTNINIYSITGALVKSIQTNVDTSFDFENGLWIVAIKDAVGQKTVKLITH